MFVFVFVFVFVLLLGLGLGLGLVLGLGLEGPVARLGHGERLLLHGLVDAHPG